MDIVNRTPQSNVKGNTPVAEEVESDVDQLGVPEKEDPKPVVQTKPAKQVEPEIKANHGTVQTTEPKPVKKVMTEHEIYALNKGEQISILKKLGATEIPHYEKDRVALIFKLQ